MGPSFKLYINHESESVFSCCCDFLFLLALIRSSAVVDRIDLGRLLRGRGGLYTAMNTLEDEHCAGSDV